MGITVAVETETVGTDDEAKTDVTEVIPPRTDPVVATEDSAEVTGVYMYHLELELDDVLAMEDTIVGSADEVAIPAPELVDC